MWKFSEHLDAGIFVYDINNKTWSEQPTTNTPTTLIGGVEVRHAWVHNNRLWLLCGEDNEHFSLHSLNLTSMMWEVVEMSGVDEPKVLFGST